MDQKTVKDVFGISDKLMEDMKLIMKESRDVEIVNEYKLAETRWNSVKDTIDEEKPAYIHARNNFERAKKSYDKLMESKKS